MAAGEPALHGPVLPGHRPFVVVIVAWFAILFTCSYPGGMFGFVEGVIRWNIRVTAYTLILVTDWCPRFRLVP